MTNSASEGRPELSITSEHRIDSQLSDPQGSKLQGHDQGRGNVRVRVVQVAGPELVETEQVLQNFFLRKFGRQGQHSRELFNGIHPDHTEESKDKRPVNEENNTQIKYEHIPEQIKLVKKREDTTRADSVQGAKFSALLIFTAFMELGHRLLESTK